jgi:hypothetical protein
VEKTKHTLSLSLSSEIGAAAIGEGIHRRRNCNYQKAQNVQIHTTHSLSLSLPLNSILCLLNQGFVSIIVANNLRKCNRKKGIWSSAAE